MKSIIDLKANGYLALFFNKPPQNL